MIAFDIETIPDVTKVDYALSSLEYRYGNTKDAEKRAVIEAEQKAKAISDMALSPFTGRICAISTVDIDTGEQSYSVIDDETDAFEIELLNTVKGKFCITEKSSPCILTWNGKKFDMPFFYKRLMLLNVEVPSGFVQLSQMLRPCSFHIDCMELLAGYKEHFSLANASKILASSNKKEMDFTKFRDMIKTEEGRHEIGRYCLSDSILTAEIYNRISKYL